MESEGTSGFQAEMRERVTKVNPMESVSTTVG